MADAASMTTTTNRSTIPKQNLPRDCSDESNFLREGVEALSSIAMLRKFQTLGGHSLILRYYDQLKYTDKNSRRLEAWTREIHQSANDNVQSDADAIVVLLFLS